MKYILPILFLGLFFSNCKKDNNQLNYNEQLAADEQIIEDYLAANNINNAQKGDLGLQYLIENPGTGTDSPTAASTVIVKYKGYFPNGEVFDEADALQTNLQGTIGGWQLGIPLFKKGGKGKLFIPSSLGYGAFPRNSAIPANQVLIFDIELINFL